MTSATKQGPSFWRRASSMTDVQTRSNSLRWALAWLAHPVSIAGSSLFARNGAVRVSKRALLGGAICWAAATAGVLALPGGTSLRAMLAVAAAICVVATWVAYRVMAARVGDAALG